MHPPDLALSCRQFRLSRRGHRAEECQDACACAPERGRFAVADGAAESAHAGLWARLLVEEFVRRPDRQPAWEAWLPPLQARWESEVGTPAGGVPLPWYLDHQHRQGAFATFLGVVVEGGCWRAFAVGDSCLFQVRDDDLVVRFPLTRAADFGNCPWLVGSRTSPTEVPGKGGARAEGGWKGGDQLWLMTDALAQWFLREAEGGKPWRELGRLLGEPDDSFVTWVEGLRSAGRLRNDDVTLVGVSL
jgi:hypothetical protein